MFKNLLQLFKYYPRLKINFYIIQILVLFFSTFQILSLVLIKPLVESIINKQEMVELNFFFLKHDLKSSIFILFFLIIFLLSSFLSVYTLKKILIFSEKIAYALKKLIFLKYLNLNYKDFVGYNSSDIQTLISVEINRSVGTIIQPLLLLIYRLIPVLMITFFLIYISFEITLALFIILALLIISLVIFFKSKLKWADRIIHSSHMGVSKSTAETFRNFKQIKVFKLENYFFNDFKSLAVKLIKALPTSRVTELTFKSIIEIIFIMFLLFLSLQIKEGQNLMSLAPNLAAFIFAIYRLLPGLQTIYATYISVKANKKSLEFLRNFKINEESKYSNLFVKNETFENNDKTFNFKLIEFQNLNYQINNKLIFENANFKFNNSKIYLLKGNSGSGKTTLVDILSGLILPDKVNIFIDGIKISENRYSNILRQVSYCAQKTALFNLSIQENITFSGDKINNEKLNKVIEICQLKDFLSEKKDGLKTKIVENGER